MNLELIRNFSIIAHIDHGKSTLADRLLELTATVNPKEMREQVLDNMDLERERGITIKAHAIRMVHRSRGRDYVLNLIDTPGHVDFSYEVSRSLAACEGVLLVVDATQGIEAQTLSNLYLALDGNLTIVPVLNKIDLSSAQVEEHRIGLADLIGVDPQEVLAVSAKEGTGVPAVLEAVVDRIPPPKGDAEAPLSALIFDSTFDLYRGVVAYVRVFDGRVAAGDWIKLMSNGKEFEVDEVGVLRLEKSAVPGLSAGDVGYIMAGIKRVADAKVGDTVTGADRPRSKPLPGYREPKPMVYSGFYPVDSEAYPQLRDGLERLKLNDASLVYEPETSIALGFGFRLGFLGLLHMEIIQERLEREYGLKVLATVPTVGYRVFLTDGKNVLVDNPAKMPPAGKIERIEEPFVASQIIAPAEYVGSIMKLAQERRGVSRQLEYLDTKRTALSYDFPLSEIIFDFYDRLKSVSRGYASFDYSFHGYREGKLVKLDMLINGNPVDALSVILHRDAAQVRGRELATKLRSIIERQLFEVVIQAAIGSRVIARETVRPLRKNVTAKCYGGDITRKRKLLERQREGKRRLKQIGNVQIPQEAFMAILARE